MTFQEDAQQLHEAWKDLWYVIFKEMGIIRLCRKLGWEPKQWITDREAKELRS